MHLTPAYLNQSVSMPRTWYSHTTPDSFSDTCLNHHTWKAAEVDVRGMVYQSAICIECLTIDRKQTTRMTIVLDTYPRPRDEYRLIIIPRQQYHTAAGVCKQVWKCSPKWYRIKYGPLQSESVDAMVGDNFSSTRENFICSQKVLGRWWLKSNTIWNIVN